VITVISAYHAGGISTRGRHFNRRPFVPKVPRRFVGERVSRFAATAIAR
jgi:hypothetical protein